MSTKYTLDMKKCEIYDSLFNENTIDEILSISEKHLNNPIFILDTSYHIITRSALAKAVNSSIETHNGNEYLLLTTMNLMVKDKCIDNIYNSSHSFFHYTDQSLIFCSIRINDLTIGYICILQNKRNFQDDDLELTNILSKVVSMQMQKENFFISSSGSDEEYYLMDLLTNKIDNIEYIKKRLKYSNFNLDENLIVLSIPFKQRFNDYRHNFALKELMGKLKIILGNSISTYYKEMIVFLVSNKEEKVISDSAKENLLKFLKLNNLQCGISIVFQNLLDIHDFFYQSVYSLNLSKNSDMKPIVYFEEYIEAYLFFISENTDNNLHRIKLSTLIHPWVAKLILFDKENKTEFLETLKAYIENNRNANSTSIKLNIHRSTFFYRFNKIQKILGISFDDSNNLFNLELSLKIIKYLGY